MEYAYATYLLSETDKEINEENLHAVLEAAGAPAQESRIKAIVAALEGIDIEGPAEDGGTARSDIEPDGAVDSREEPVEQG